MMNAPTPQLPPDMLMAMMTDPRSTPQQKMAAMSALNASKGVPPSGAPLPAMQGDSTGISTMHPAFAEAVRDEVSGGGRGQSPAPQQSPATSALMMGAADANRVASGGMARGGAVRGYAGGGDVATDLDPSMMTGGNMDPGASSSGDDSDPHGYYATIKRQLASDRGGISSQDKYLALLEASLGTMAAASRPGATFLGSIGQGGLGGIQGLRQAQAARAEERMKNAGLAGSLAEHEATVQARRDALKQQAAENAASRAARKEQADADRASREGISKDNAELRTTLATGSQAIQAQLAEARRVAADAAAASAPTGVIPPTPEAAKAVGIPFEGIPNPYEKVSAKTAEAMFRDNEKVFEGNQVKQQQKQTDNESVRNDLKRFNVLNEAGITGPSNALPGVGSTKKFFSPELQEADSITSRLAPMLRNGLPGSASDADVRMFKGAGPEISKDKDANRPRIAGLMAAIDNQDDKMQFDRDFFSVHHHMQGAAKAWKDYLNANPIFDHSKGAQPFTLNPTRKTYQEWFGGDITAPTNSAAAIVTPDPASAPAARPPLSSFGGK